MVKARERSKRMFEPKRKAELLRLPFYGAKKLGEVSFELGDFVLCEIARGFGWLGAVGRVPIRFGGENLKGKPNYDVGTVLRIVAQSGILTGQLQDPVRGPMYDT